MEIPVLYEDKNIVIVNKPAGLVVHGDGKIDEYTLVDWILEKYPKMKNIGEPLVLADGTEIVRPGIVHRLDRETSGVLLIAKTQKAFDFYKDKFKGRQIKKIYHAFVWGEMKEEEGKINRPIGRSSSDFRRFSAQRGARGEMRDALTEYRVLHRGKGFSFVSITLKTGRTHQIRVHFSAINHPVVSDTLYAPNMKKQLGFKRVALHSYAISFIDQNDKEVTVKAVDPADFKVAAKKIGLI
jgi:23S rRNA pseudouridine1911/1915/1917 synthase